MQPASRLRRIDSTRRRRTARAVDRRGALGSRSRRRPVHGRRRHRSRALPTSRVIRNARRPTRRATRSSWSWPGSRLRRTCRCLRSAVVCRCINVAAGGTLIQDIPSEVNQAARTPDRHAARTRSHTRSGSLAVCALSNVMQEQLADGEVLQVNSRHHQAVKQTARRASMCRRRRLMASSRPSSARDARFCIAVQWHPENFWRTGEFRALFEEFVKAARNRHAILDAASRVPSVQAILVNRAERRPTFRHARCSETSRTPRCGSSRVSRLDESS